LYNRHGNEPVGDVNAHASLMVTAHVATSNWCGQTGVEKDVVHGKRIIVEKAALIPSAIARYFAGIAISAHCEEGRTKIG
jgi:hypothetical protein